MSGVRELIKLHKKNYSTALMIDQRVTEGIKSSFLIKMHLQQQFLLN